jgi:hypothetical protein
MLFVSILFILYILFTLSFWSPFRPAGFRGSPTRDAFLSKSSTPRECG